MTITNVYESLSPEDSGDRVGVMVFDRGSLKFVVEGSSEIDGSGEIVGCFVGSFVGVAVAAVGGETNPLVGSNDGYDDGCDSQKEDHDDEFKSCQKNDPETSCYQAKTHILTYL